MTLGARMRAASRAKRLRLRAGADHLSRAENERRGLWGADAHNGRGKTLRMRGDGGRRQCGSSGGRVEKGIGAIFRVSHLGVVLHVARVKRDGFRSSLQSRLTVQTMFLRGRDWWVSLDAAPSSHGGARKKTARVGRGEDGGTHCSWGTIPEGCTARSTAPSVGGAGAATTALDGPAASGWAGASSAPLMFEGLDAKKSTEGEIPPFLFQPLFKREGGRAQAGGCPRGVPTRLDAKRRDLGETRSKYLPDGVGSRHLGAGFWRETREEFRRGSGACHARGSRPEKCSRRSGDAAISIK